MQHAPPPTEVPSPAGRLFAEHTRDPEAVRRLYAALEAEMAHGLEHYDRICPGIAQRVRSGTGESIAMATRAIRFMNATGLRTSSTWPDLFGGPAIPRGFDHTLVWRKDRDYLVTTEPYRASDGMASAIAWCEARGWACIERPAWSMWCLPHTTLLLCTPPKNGLDVAGVVGDLDLKYA